MDTSINFGTACPLDLHNSQFSEERDLADKIKIVFEQLAENLKPILKYISTSYEIYASTTLDGFTRGCRNKVRAIEVCQHKGNYLLLREDGVFFLCVKTSIGEPGKFRAENTSRVAPYTTWGKFPFEMALASLQRYLKTAQEKREKHLASIRERREDLDKILAILQK